MKYLIIILIIFLTAMATQAQMDDKQTIEALYKQMYRAATSLAIIARYICL